MSRIIIILSLLLLAFCPSLLADDLGYATVTRVVDGDTLVLSDLGKVRLIGIDTPETVHPSKPVEYMGKEASEATKQLALGKLVKIETDIQARDKYGRLLAYIYLPDGSMLNAELVRKGYAQVSTYPPNVKYQDKFLRLQKASQALKIGLWYSSTKKQVKADVGHSRGSAVDADVELSGGSTVDFIHITKTGKKYHKVGCKSLQNSDITISQKEAIQKGYTSCNLCKP